MPSVANRPFDRPYKTSASSSSELTSSEESKSVIKKNNMKIFVVLSCMTALTAARPEADYSYSGPVQNQYNQQSDYVSGPPQGQRHNSDYNNAASPQSHTTYEQQSQQQGDQRDSYTLDVTPQKGPKPVYGAGLAQVHKHVYVHVAPPEDEEVAPRQPLPIQPAQKHYKIIFIKAPAYQQNVQQMLQAPVSNEEKTLVYVLVKKPDEVVPETVKQVEFKPSKPEVYFIKYKAQKEAVATAPNSEYGPPTFESAAATDILWGTGG